MIKSGQEITSIRRACRITDECFRLALPSILPGVTERSIVLALERLFRRFHAEPAFPIIAAFGVHTSIVHYLTAKTSHTRCRKQEIVLLDFGVKVDGYCSDMTRMVFVGKPKTEWMNAYKTVLSVQKKCLDRIRSFGGIPFSGATLDRYARRLLKKSGLPPYPHGLGHNLGKKIHELPRLSRKKDAMITPGMVFTIEPGTYIKDEFGIRIEDTVLLKKDHLVMFTKSPKHNEIS